MNNPTTFHTQLGNLSLSEFLRKTTMCYNGSTIWYEIPKIIPEKKLTEKQLFAKLKKELKEVTVKLN